VVVAEEEAAVTEERALMAVYDKGHRISLRNGYWLEKQDDNGWWLGRGWMNLALKIAIIQPSVPVGRGGSIDQDIRDFANAINDSAAEERHMYHDHER
jgi:hypothetical protein